MSRNKKQYYIVINGRKPGIYTQWFGVGQAAEQVRDFPQAVYKGFFTREEALNWLREFPVKTLAPELVDFLGHPAKQDVRQAGSPGALEAAALAAGKVVIFTDGGAIGNPGPGGYGVVLKYNHHRKELSGGFRLTTNNRMELMACIVGLQSLKTQSEVVIFSDSKYVVEAMTKGWARRWQANGWMRNKKDKAENSDLWERLLALCDRHSVQFHWVKGHNSTRENERCDQLAVAAARSRGLLPDPGYEQAQNLRQFGWEEINHGNIELTKK